MNDRSGEETDQLETAQQEMGQQETAQHEMGQQETAQQDTAQEEPGQHLGLVQLLGIPLSIAARSNEHHATLMRELALVDAAEDSSTAHGRLLSLAAELRAKYARFGQAQRARAQAAAAAGERSIDLAYEAPVRIADDVEQLATLLEEVDAFCRGGELVTLVAPPDVAAYRQWVFDQFRTQLRDGAAPIPWAPVGDADETGVAPDMPTRADVIAIDEDLDLEGSARVRDLIAQKLEEGTTDLTIDLRGCEFVDSVGISLLLTTLTRLRDSGGSLCLVHVAEQIRRTLGHAGILELLVRD